jgi:hypothetical protein
MQKGNFVGTLVTNDGFAPEAASQELPQEIRIFSALCLRVDPSRCRATF